MFLVENISKFLLFLFILNIMIERVIGQKRSIECNKYTGSSNEFELDKSQIHFAIKTTANNVQRWDLLNKTWIANAPESTTIISDFVTDDLKRLLPNQKYLTTSCDNKHTRKGLACKMEAAFEDFLESNYSTKWLCVMDDDMYVNVPKMIELLQCFDTNKNWYIGSPGRGRKNILNIAGNVTVDFWYAQGSLYCMPRLTVATIIGLIFRNVDMNEDMIFGDDVQLGYINEVIMNNEMTHVHELFHHNRDLTLVNEGMIENVVSFSFRGKNVVQIAGFSEEEDPTRFLSAHCIIEPWTEYCQQRRY